ncbi:MAG: hypothetical protein KAK04_07470, partial [Cyclobacteriaceae bacterium]|nr:hypothetical protein [Cyclobacteriaceae bacterium]
HREQFYAIEKYYKEEFNIEIDKACKDVSRAMLLSYDPEIYWNPHSDVFEELFTPPVKKESPSKSYRRTTVTIPNSYPPCKPHISFTTSLIYFYRKNIYGKSREEAD